jgi:hypothetical protein
MKTIACQSALRSTPVAYFFADGICQPYVVAYTLLTTVAYENVSHAHHFAPAGLALVPKCM